MKLANKTIEISKKDVQKIKTNIETKEMSKGAAIRALFAEGYAVKEISDILGIRYNHVYNVVQNEVFVHGLEVERTRQTGDGGKKEEIIQMLQAGKTIRQVSEELRMLYNSVWQIAKAAGLTPKQLKEGQESATQEDVAV